MTQDKISQDKTSPILETPPPAATPPRKRHRLRRWLLGLLLAVVLLLVVVAGLGWYAVSTESGTRALLARATRFLPGGELTIGAQRGPLTGPLDLRDVHFHTATMDLRLSHVHLAWKAGRLRQRLLDVDQLHAEGIRVALAKSDTPSNGKLVNIHLPVNILVRDALIRDLEIDRAGQPPFRLDRIALDAQSERLRDLLHVRSLAVDGPIFQLRAAGDLNPVGDYAVNLQAQATYKDPKFPPFAVAGHFTGTLETLGVDATLNQPFDAHVRGTVLTPMRQVGMDLAAQVKGFNARAINPQWPLALIRQGDVTIKGQLNDFTSQGRILGAYETYGAGEADYRLARHGDDFVFEYLNLKTEKGAAVAARGTVSLPTAKSELGLDVTAEMRGINTQAIDPQWPLAVIRQGNVAIKGRLSDFTSQGRVAGSYQDLAAGTVDYRVVRKGDDLAFPAVSLRTDQGATLNARGRASLAKGGRLDLSADWNQLAYPLKGGPPVVVSQTGKGHVAGTLADYQLDVDAQLAGPGVPPGHWVLAGRGTPEKMDVRSLRGDVLSGQLAAAGTVAWKPQIAWHIQANGNGIDPAALAQYAAWPGRVDFAAASEGSLRNGAVFGRVDVNQLGGQLRGNPLDGNAHLQMAGDRYTLPQLDLRSGTARLTASGAFTKTAASNLDFRLAAPNLAEALPSVTGSLTAQGRLAGPWKGPRIAAQASGQSLAYQTYSAQTLALTADVDLASSGPLVVSLKAGNVGFGARKYDTVTLTSQGTRPAHQIALAVKQATGGLDLALAGGLQGKTTWSGQIRRLDLVDPQAGTWKLAGPAGLTAGTSQAALKGFCWTSGAARLCADGQWIKNGPWSGNGTVADVPFSLLKPFLPPDLQVTGAVGGTFAGTGSPRGVVTANLDLHPGPGDLRYPGRDGKMADIHFDQGTVRVVAGAGGLTGHADLAFVNTGVFRADLRLPQYNAIGAPLQSQTLGGHIVADFTSLALVEAFVPDLANTRGTLNADLTLGGTVAKPAITGAAQLQQAQVDVPEYGLQVRQIQLTARSTGQGPMQIQGSARSGTGTANIGGTVALDGSPSRITLDGRNFLVSNTQEIKVLASPKLQVALSGTRVDVTGDIDIPEMAVNQEKRTKGAVGVSKDVIIVPPTAEMAKQPAKPSRQLYARVRAVLGEKVTVKVVGFSGGLTGSLLVSEEPGKATTAVGELEVKDGVYKAYGQDLTLDHGRLIFAGGPVDNPGLDLKAFRKATDGTVAGITIAGTLRAPQATLYSDPPMDESNALAYLLLGHPLGQSSPQEGNLLANAATSLGLKGGNMVAKKIASRFGLQEARLETTGGVKETSLVVGKYLSPRLYVNYGIGLFQPINTFTIRYLLGRQWNLQAQQGAAVGGQGQATGVDILYTVERGKGGATPPPPKQDRGEDVKGPKGTDAQGTGGSGGR
ncbi:MAG TPA: translocation/assembly module TamB domain-containing protein [Thermoanaerobaculia bacterium]|jgi:translocation and assembly module TamB